MHAYLETSHLKMRKHLSEHAQDQATTAHSSMKIVSEGRTTRDVASPVWVGGFPRTSFTALQTLQLIRKSATKRVASKDY